MHRDRGVSLLKKNFEGRRVVEETHPLHASSAGVAPGLGAYGIPTAPMQLRKCMNKRIMKQPITYEHARYEHSLGHLTIVIKELTCWS